MCSPLLLLSTHWALFVYPFAIVKRTLVGGKKLSAAVELLKGPVGYIWKIRKYILESPKLKLSTVTEGAKMSVFPAFTRLLELITNATLTFTQW